MDGKRITIVGIIAVLIGILAGYLFWGTRVRDLAAELQATRAQAQQAQAQQSAIAARVQALEAQVKEATEQLAAVKTAREQLQARQSRGKK